MRVPSRTWNVPGAYGQAVDDRITSRQQKYIELAFKVFEEKHRKEEVWSLAFDIRQHYIGETNSGWDVSVMAIGRDHAAQVHVDVYNHVDQYFTEIMFLSFVHGDFEDFLDKECDEQPA